MALAKVPNTVDLRKYIEVRLMGDKPHVRGRRLPVAVLAYSARDNDLNAEELAAAFDITTAQALAALLYYEENRALIDDQERSELAQVEMWVARGDID
jgi:uncharacterized protein (DUF433 family)